MTYQTTEPVRELSMGVSARAWGDLIHQVERGDISYDLPYQRGDVWTTGQRVMLIYSILAGTPVPALIINSRPESMWFAPDGTRRPIYAVIDGKQRITAVQMFMDGRLAVHDADLAGRCGISSMSPTNQRANLRSTADRLESGSARLTASSSRSHRSSSSRIRRNGVPSGGMVSPFLSLTVILSCRVDRGYSIPYTGGHDANHVDPGCHQGPADRRT